MCKIVQDIAGGLATTVPTYRDWENPALQPYIDKYLAAKAGVPTIDRLRALRLVKDMTHNYYQIDHIHGEGSMAAQQMFLYFSTAWDQYKAAAKRAAHIDGWQDNPVYGSLPGPRTSIKMPAVDKLYPMMPPEG